MENPTVQTTTEPSVGQESTHNTFFATEKERRDVAVGLALTGQSLEAALKPLRDSYDLKLKELQSTDSTASFISAISDQERVVKEKEAAVVNAKVDIERLRAEDRELNARHAESQVRKQDSWQRIRQARHERAKEFFDERKADLEAELHHTRSEITADAEHRLEVSRLYHEVEKKNFEENKEEFARRVAVCNHEKTIVENQLNEAQKHADRLKAIGITRTTATFLFVVGFVSIAGSGSAISSLISDRQPGEPIFSLLLRHLFLYGQANLHGPWRLLALIGVPFALILTLLLGLLVLYVLVRIVDRLVKDFDPRWYTGQSERERRPTPLQDQFTDLTAQFTGLPTKFGNFRSFNVERRHYTKLLASFPYILIGGVIFFLFSGVAFDDSGRGIVLNLTTTYIGVTFILIATTFWLIYISKVIEPRWERATSVEAGTDQPPRRFWVNRELIAVLLLMVLALTLAGLLPIAGNDGGYLSTSQYKHIVWSFVALFMAFGSLSLAFGIIHRGVFKDIDYLSRKRDSYRYWIERYSARPTIEDASTYLGDDGASIFAYLDRRGKLDQDQLSYELNEIFSDDLEPEQPPLSIHNLWRRLAHPRAANSPPQFRLKDPPPSKPRLIDYSIAPEATQTFVASELEIARIEQRKTDIGQEIRKLENALNNLATELSDLRTSLMKLRAQQLTAQHARANEIGELRDAREKEIMKFKAEFAVGVTCREALDEDAGNIVLRPEDGGAPDPSQGAPAAPVRR